MLDQSVEEGAKQDIGMVVCMHALLMCDLTCGSGCSRQQHHDDRGSGKGAIAVFLACHGTVQSKQEFCLRSLGVRGGTCAVWTAHASRGLTDGALERRVEHGGHALLVALAPPARNKPAAATRSAFPHVNEPLDADIV